LKPDFQLQTTDLLGHGARSHDGSESFGLEAVTKDLLTQIPAGPFIGVGHSFGLRPLLRAAAKQPERVKALIFEDSSPALSESGYREIRGILNDIPVPFPSREEAKDFLERLYGPGHRMARFLLSQIRERPEGHTWRFDRAGLSSLLEESRNASLWKEWAEFEGPIHMILGQESGFVSAERLEQCRRERGFKPLEVDHIPQAGHWVHADQLGQFVTKLADILNKMNLNI
jgi:pimeloyl-ACP methyl ester carboxylesterase